MKRLSSWQFFTKYKFGFAIFAILLLAVFLRFYEYDSRLVLAGDQARDAIVGREALKHLAIPALGPFSSAGNYTTGNVWYIWVIGSTAFFPYSILTPWVVLSIAFVVLVYCMIYIGKELLGKQMAIILGLLTAVSPAQIAQSFNLTNPSLVALSTGGTVYFMIKYVKTGRSLFLFLFAFLISCSISLHFQSVYLLVLIPLVVILKPPVGKGILFLVFGAIIPFISYIVFDITHNFYNLRGILDYAQYGQHNIYVANRWLTYIGEFWPRLWGNIIGGSSVMGYIFIALAIIMTIYAAVTKKMSKPLFIIIMWFVIAFIGLRFYKGERFDGYFIFLHIFVLIITAWFCFLLIKINKYVGFLLISLVIMGSIAVTMNQISGLQDGALRTPRVAAEMLVGKYPEERFTLYRFKNTSEGVSIPLVLYLDQKDRNVVNGYKIGIGSPEKMERKYHKQIKRDMSAYELWDLNASSSPQLEKSGWQRITPSDIYQSVVEWYK